MNSGFLGTEAPRYADVVLLLELGMGVALVIGAVLARKGRYRSHAWCQSAVAVLNLVVVILAMVPTFREQVSPKIPQRLNRSYYALASAHGALGGIAEVAALYIVIAAGTKVLPEGLRLKRYKPWMRSVLVSWWVVLLLGVATYARWYVPQLFRR